MGLAEEGAVAPAAAGVVLRQPHNGSDHQRYLTLAPAWTALPHTSLLSAWSFTDDGSQNRGTWKSGSPSRNSELLPPPPGATTHGALEKACRVPKRQTSPGFTLAAIGAAPHQLTRQERKGAAMYPIPGVR